jgi:hypothetical protein
MQPFPIAYMPEIPPPCFSLRSRREVNAVDMNNSRLVEHWQTDSPALTNAMRDTRGSSRYQDMNPTPSRLYREDMQQAQPFVVASQNPKLLQELAKIDKAMANALKRMELTKDEDLIQQEKELYKVLVQNRRQLTVDNLGNNPYFEKYDVQGDTRNIIRELQSVVKEDVVDRGTEESRRLLRRGMENRWITESKEDKKDVLDSITAFELMRPKFNKQEKTYF